MAYYINQMKDIRKTNIKYQYLDHMEATIDIRQNYWQCFTRLYCINDFNLPPGAFVANLELPYQEIKDISLYLASNQDLPQKQKVPDKKYCHIYESTFNVDVSGNEFFKQDINNTKINCCVKLEIDPQVIKSAGIKDLKQEDLDGLIDETSSIRWDFSMYYSNTHKVEHASLINNISGYQLDEGHECSNKISLINVSSNTYDKCINSINELVSFKSNTAFQILQAKVKFNYWIEQETEGKNLEFTLSVDRQTVYEQTLNLNQNTSFDFVNNKVVINTGGIPGFYIPKHSHGYYEMELLLNQNGNINKFIIKNDFKFLNNINNPQVGISKLRIESLSGFRKVIW